MTPGTVSTGGPPLRQGGGVSSGPPVPKCFAQNSRARVKEVTCGVGECCGASDLHRAGMLPSHPRHLQGSAGRAGLFPSGWSADGDASSFLYRGLMSGSYPSNMLNRGLTSIQRVCLFWSGLVGLSSSYYINVLLIADASGVD